MVCDTHVVCEQGNTMVCDTHVVCEQGNTWVYDTHAEYVQGNTWVDDTHIVNGQVYEWGNTWSGGTQAFSVSSKQHNTVYSQHFGILPTT